MDTVLAYSSRYRPVVLAAGHSRSRERRSLTWSSQRYALLRVLEGTITVTLAAGGGGKALTLRPGDWWLEQPGIEGEITVAPASRWQFIYAALLNHELSWGRHGTRFIRNPQELDEPAERIFGTALPVIVRKSDTAYLNRLFSDIISSYVEGPIDYLRIDALLGLIYAELLRSSGPKPSTNTRDDHSGDLKAAVQGMLTQDARARLSTATIAQRLGMSREHLSRRFSADYAQTLDEFVRMQRMAKAAAGLRAGASIAEAMAEAGYRSAGAFRRCFSLVMGQSPGRYRSQWLLGGERATSADTGL